MHEKIKKFIILYAEPLYIGLFIDFISYCELRCYFKYAMISQRKEVDKYITR